MKPNVLKKVFEFIMQIIFKKNIIIIFLFLFSLDVAAQSPKITFSEINYNSDSTISAGDWIELHNYDSSVIDISNWIFTDSDFTHFYLIPAPTALAPGEYLVLCQDNNKFTNRFPSVNNVIGPFTFGLSGKGELVRLIDNQNNILLSMTYLDTLPWPKGADGNGRTLELIDPQVDLNDGENWFAGCMGGSPGTNYQPCNEPVIFSEINFNSHPSLSTADWVEIHNVSTQPVDISSWIFRDKKDSNSYILPSNTSLDPGDFLVLAENKEKFSSVFPNVTNVVGPFKFGIKPTNEVIRLFDASGAIYLSLAYNNSPPWPGESIEPGFTLELTDSSNNLNDGNNWFYGCLGGSPGTYFSTPCQFNVSIEEEQKLFSSTVYPNPFSNSATIEFNTGNPNQKSTVTLSIFDALGKMASPVYPVSINMEKSTIKYPLKGEYFAPGIYFYHIKTEQELLTSGKIIILK